MPARAAGRSDVGSRGLLVACPHGVLFSRPSECANGQSELAMRLTADGLDEYLTGSLYRAT
jgi:hypothetical protein